MVTVIIFILGAIVGSFLNVVVLRFGTGLPIVSGRSKCFSCFTTLKWFELIPIFSFLFLKGKCRTCFSKVSNQYFLVELATGILFAGIYHMYLIGRIVDPLLFLLYLAISCLFIVITVYDFHHKIIPDTFVFLFISLAALVGLINFFNVDHIERLLRIINLLAGLIIFLPFYLLWKYSEGKWIGLGDGKLAIGIGFLLGLPEGLSAIVFSFWIGAIWAVFIITYQKVVQYFSLYQGVQPLTMKSEVPFGPFMLLSTVLVFVFPIDIFSLHILFGL